MVPQTAMRVFVVEDNDDYYEMLQDMLTRSPCVNVVGRAVAANDAIHAIEQQHPDLAIVDLNLLRGSGLDVLKAVREIRSPPKLLAMSDADGYEAAVEAGADWFYPKATGFGDLLNRVTWLQVELFDDTADWYHDAHRNSVFLPSAKADK